VADADDENEPEVDDWFSAVTVWLSLIFWLEIVWSYRSLRSLNLSSLKTEFSLMTYVISDLISSFWLEN
jgi:hypothetical protein